MIIRKKGLELLFAQLTPLISIVVGPLSTAIIVVGFAPADQGRYYLLASLATVVGILQLGDVEAAMTRVDSRAPQTTVVALSALLFWRITIAVSFASLVCILGATSTILGVARSEVLVGGAYLLLVAINTIAAAPHQLSQALAVPYWRRRFYEFGLYSAALLVSLYLMQSPIALVIAASVSVAANLFYSALVLSSDRIRNVRWSDAVVSGGFQEWRVHVLPHQTSTGLAHIYAQMGFRLLVPAAAATLGIIFAGKVGATLSILGLLLGMLQQRLRVHFPALARVQRPAGRHPELVRRLERGATIKVSGAMVAAGFIFMLGLLLASSRFAWLTERFASSFESLLLALILALTGIVGVKMSFRLSEGRRNVARGWPLLTAITLAILTPAAFGHLFGAIGFWLGGFVGPILILVVHHLVPRGP